jgi:hypothetical protein
MKPAKSNGGQCAGQNSVTWTLQDNLDDFKMKLDENDQKRDGLQVNRFHMRNGISKLAKAAKVIHLDNSV